MTTATKTGGAVLPVVAKVGDLIITVREQVMVDFGSVNQEWLVLKSDAQATIDELRAEVERLRKERDEINDARNAAIERSNFMFAATRDAQGVASLANDRWAALQRRFSALEAKQIDVEAVMRLADEYARSMWSHKSTSKQTDAAREALHASLLGDGGTL